MNLKKIFQVPEHIVVGKTMENEKEHRDTKLVKGIIWFQNQTVIQQNFPLENLLAIEMKKKTIFINKPVYLGLSIL